MATWRLFGGCTPPSLSLCPPLSLSPSLSHISSRDLSTYFVQFFERTPCARVGRRLAEVGWGLAALWTSCILCYVEETGCEFRENKSPHIWGHRSAAQFSVEWGHAHSCFCCFRSVSSQAGSTLLWRKTFCAYVLAIIVYRSRAEVSGVIKYSFWSF